MPNHVTNFVKAPVHVLLALLNNKLNPDFERVIPTTLPFKDAVSDTTSMTIARNFELLKAMTPEERNAFFINVNGKNHKWESFNVTEEGRQLVTRPIVEVGNEIFQNLLQTGFPTWYEWNIHHWGTKWMPYQVMANLDDNDPFIVFQTAWSSPFPVFEAVSRAFPNEMVSVAYADEDTCHNFGIVGFINGYVTPLQPAIFLNEKLQRIKTIFDFCVSLTQLNHHGLAPTQTEPYAQWVEEDLFRSAKGRRFIESWEEVNHFKQSPKYFETLENQHKTVMSVENYDIQM